MDEERGPEASYGLRPHQLFHLLFLWFGSSKTLELYVGSLTDLCLGRRDEVQYDYVCLSCFRRASGAQLIAVQLRTGKKRGVGQHRVQF